jgi:hypothetical protein
VVAIAFTTLIGKLPVVAIKVAAIHIGSRAGVESSIDVRPARSSLHIRAGAWTLNIDVGSTVNARLDLHIAAPWAGHTDAGSNAGIRVGACADVRAPADICSCTSAIRSDIRACSADVCSGPGPNISPGAHSASLSERDGTTER